MNQTAFIGVCSNEKNVVDGAKDLLLLHQILWVEASNQFRERGTVRVRFLLVLQYVVGANHAHHHA